MKPVLPSPIIQLHHKVLENKEIEIFVKREDLIHKEIMGNKWRKLKYNLEAAQKLKKRRLVTFGGAYSNHIAATAAAAHLYGFESKGIIRGEELNAESNLTLKTAAAKGMSFEFVPREEFRTLKKTYTKLEHFDFLIPEGGTNDLALEGVAEIIKEIEMSFDIMVTPVGTGGTLVGLIKGLNGRSKIWGFSALKGEFIRDEIRQLRVKNKLPHSNYELFTNYHFGGYGKINQDLKRFIHTFKQEFNVLLDPVYTGKMFFGVWEKVKNDQIAPGTRLLVLHTGGLQGLQESI